MKYLKAVALGMVGAFVALILWWIPISVYLTREMHQSRELPAIPESWALPLLLYAAMMAAGGFVAGFVFMLRLQRDLPTT